MRIKKIDLLTIIIVFLVVYIVIVGLIINKKSKNSVVDNNTWDNDVSIEFLVSGTYENIGCLSVYLDDNNSDDDFSFDDGRTWQKSSYGAIYKNGKTSVLIRNKKNNTIYKKDVNVTTIVNDAPVINMGFENTVTGVTDKELLQGVTAKLNNEDVLSKVKVNVLDRIEDEVLVSYLADINGKKCYLVKYVNVVEPEHTIVPSPTSIPTPSPTPSNSKWYWPTKKPYSISQKFRENKHNGIDIYGPKRGSAIYAAGNGIVYDITHNSSSGYYVIIKHDNGYYTRYAHMQNIYGNDKAGSKGSATKYIKKGDRVSSGTQIGELGSSGKSTGPHLHFEIWNGIPFKSKAFNPLSFY